MAQITIPAAFMRGGTSKAIMFDRRDLPADVAQWDDLFLAAMGSPDGYGRQLNGMGGGVSSLSKVCVISPSTRDDSDVDYTFAQIQIREASVGYRTNCGNMSSAIGPFAVDQGMMQVEGDTALVRIFNTNTGKLIHARFPLEEGRTKYNGDLAIPGVSGTGAPIRLDFLSPGGATTGKLLPTGNPVDLLDIPGVGKIEVSMVDAANACVFVRADALGLTGRELPEEIEAHPDAMQRLEAIRVCASLAMRITQNEAEARSTRGVPFVGFVSTPADASTLTDNTIRESEIDFAARIISNGQPHRALPLTAALCTAVAARIDGSVVATVLGKNTPKEGQLRLGMPSGVLNVDAELKRTADGAWEARSGSFYRTARLLFSGLVYVPAR